MPTVAVDKGEAWIVDAHHDGVALHEAVADFRLACMSRAIDDREIALRAAEPRVLPDLGCGPRGAAPRSRPASCGPATTGSFPTTGTVRWCSALGVSPDEMLLQAVGSRRRPGLRRASDAMPLGRPRPNIVTQSSRDRYQCLPAVGCAEAARYIVRRNLPGCTAHGDELTYVSLGEGATSEGEFWESLNTACRSRLPVALRRRRQRIRDLRCDRTDQAPAPISEMVRRLPRACTSRPSMDATTSTCAGIGARRHRARACRTGSRIGARHRDAAVLPFALGRSDEVSDQRGARRRARPTTRSRRSRTSSFELDALTPRAG